MQREEVGFYQITESIIMKYFFLLSLFCLSFALGEPNITCIILSQYNEYDLNLSIKLKQTIEIQSKDLKLATPKVYISTQDFNIPGDWTIFPLILPVLDVIEGKSIQWVVFLENSCNVSLSLLLSKLLNYNPSHDIWVGHALYDSEATIIHHFAFHKDPTFFKYPNIHSGIIFSIPLLKRLKNQLIKHDYKIPDFHIDPAHEIALFVYNDGKGSMIVDDPVLCPKEGIDCAIYPKKIQTCDEADITAIYFAVKTCKKYHKDRIEAVKKTWSRYTSKVTFFSDIEDSMIPTISLGIPNTEHGHCDKTLAILEFLKNEISYDKSTLWIMLVDDDTILSVSRVANLLTCYNSSVPLILGERYRFGTTINDGFDYATGGSGILINRPALQLLLQACKCPRPDSPDDMVLGACAHEAGIKLVHVPQMHQARPMDYAPARLANLDAVTFHKHWMVNPVEIYSQWFKNDDERIVEKIVKVEL